MKIILSPSKTQDIRLLQDLPQFEKKDIEGLDFSSKEMSQLKKQKTLTKQLVKQLQSTEADIIKKKMKLSDTLLKEVVKNYSDFNKRSGAVGHSAYSYTGTVFKELKFCEYNYEAINYMHEHLLILSALYGPIPATMKIKPYRLDMTMALFEESLYSYWKDTYKKWFYKEDIIIDLSSKEFSKQVEGNKLTFEFLQPVKGEYKTIAFHSKQGRGLMANYLIENQITDLEDIKKFNALGYEFDDALSNEMHYVFKKINH